MIFPRPSLTNFVRTLLISGNTPDNLDLDRLAQFNTWTDADQILVEFKIQQNGTRKLPEEAASVSVMPAPVEEVEE